MSNEYQSKLDQIEREESNESEFEKGNLVYNSRMRELIKNVATVEDFGNLRISPAGELALQNSLRFILVMFTYELLEILRLNKKKTITTDSVNDALSNLLGKADSFALTMNGLEDLMKNLQSHSNESAITKAMDFVNLLDRYDSEPIEDDEEFVEEEVDKR
ncbi:hypothetical protein L2089_01960 [Paenibacillus hunanensis]|uniref:hypothetical protein n=1 Tax=Paenibacillus hunanensis TaxID=539262 RepID=UPI002025D528|nr:hypothetical protein [Paenibacillus hunanensis]MCL9659429.1 hypothetical protein [Paenibacillus hunanensis]